MAQEAAVLGAVGVTVRRAEGVAGRASWSARRIASISRSCSRA